MPRVKRDCEGETSNQVCKVDVVAGIRSWDAFRIGGMHSDRRKMPELPAWTVAAAEAGMRLDKYLADRSRLGSRSRVSDALAKGKIFVNGSEAKGGRRWLQAARRRCRRRVDRPAGQRTSASKDDRRWSTRSRLRGRSGDRRQQASRMARGSVSAATRRRVGVR